MDLQEAAEKTHELRQAFDSRTGTYDLQTSFIALVEEVGELGNAILVDENNKPTGRRKSEIANSLCDILFHLLAISKIQNINLDAEYQKVLEELRHRLERGEFDHHVI